MNIGNNVITAGDRADFSWENYKEKILFSIKKSK